MKRSAGYCLQDYVGYDCATRSLSSLSKASKTFVDFLPAPVVEILSPSTALKDRHTKCGQGIPCDGIVSPDSDEAEVYVLEENKYVLKQKGNTFTDSLNFEKDCAAPIDFSETWK